MADERSQGFFPPDLMAEVRERFTNVDSDPFSGRRTYFEASGGSLRLRSVVETVAREAALPDELYRYNPASERVVDAVDRGTADVMLFLGARSGAVVPSHSATQSMFRIVDAVASSVPGDNIVTTELEHPAVLGATQFYAAKHGKVWRVAKLDRRTSSVPIDNILGLVDRNTCLLAVQHGSNQTGAINDVKTIIREARRVHPELYVLVDAVQYAPHGPIDVEDYGADAYAFGPYKAYCVKGIGFAHVSERLARLPHERLYGKPETNWMLGSPAHMMYAAWSATVDYLGWLGGRFTASEDRRARIVAAKEAIHGHMKALLLRALHGTAAVPGLLRQGHVSVCGMPDPLDERLCIFLFRLAGMDSSTAIGRYNSEHGVRLAARIRDAYSSVPLDAMGWPDAVRLSAGHYNTPEEIDRMLAATSALGGR